LFKIPNDTERRDFGEIVLEPGDLFWFEILGVTAHEGEKASVFSACGIKLLPDLEEVVVDESDNVKTIGNDLGVREETPCDPAVGFGEVHDDDSDLIFVKKPLERALESEFRASEEDIVNPVLCEVAEGGSITLLAREEVLIDAEDSGAGIIFHL